jgi:hypothetical protein
VPSKRVKRDHSRDHVRFNPVITNFMDTYLITEY